MYRRWFVYILYELYVRNFSSARSTEIKGVNKLFLRLKNIAKKLDVEYFFFACLGIRVSILLGLVQVWWDQMKYQENWYFFKDIDSIFYHLSIQ